MALIGLPFAWLGLFFVFPLLIVLKISLAQSVIGIPPYTPLFTNGNEEIKIHATLANFVLLAGDDLYVRAYLGALGNAALATALCLVFGIRLLMRSRVPPPVGGGCSCSWSCCRFGRVF
jgi:putrescine transport system permease protein